MSSDTRKVPFVARISWVIGFVGGLGASTFVAALVLVVVTRAGSEFANTGLLVGIGLMTLSKQAESLVKE